MISRKKRVYTTTTMERKKKKEKNSFYRIRTMNTQTFLKKKYVDGINYWSSALTTSAKKKKRIRRAGARKWNKKYKNQSIRDTEMTSHERMWFSAVDWLINSLSHASVLSVISLSLCGTNMNRNERLIHYNAHGVVNILYRIWPAAILRRRLVFKLSSTLTMAFSV